MWSLWSTTAPGGARCPRISRPGPGVYHHLAAWEAAGITQDLLDGLRARARLREGRVAAPSAAVIDPASIQAAETVGAASRGYDAGKKINGRRRHIAVDTLGLLLCVLVTAASTQDREAATPLLARLRAWFRRVRLVGADGGYAGTLLDWAITRLTLTVGDRQTQRGDGRVCRASPAAGSSSAPWPGSPDTAAACATTNASRPTTRPWSAGA
jgi:Transposase DDE domain